MFVLVRQQREQANARAEAARRNGLQPGGPHPAPAAAEAPAPDGGGLARRARREEADDDDDENAA